MLVKQVELHYVTVYVNCLCNSQAARHLYPALTVKVFFSLDFIYLVSLDRISGGYQEDILEQFEKSKMAAKMAAIVKKKIKSFNTIHKISSNITFSTKYCTRNPFLRLIL